MNKCPKRKPDLILPGNDNKELGEIHIWIKENMFLNAGTGKCFKDTIRSTGDKRYNAEEYIRYELERDNSSSSRREIVLNYLVEKGLLDE